MKDDTRVQFEDYFTVIPPQNLLICNTCRYAVSKTEIGIHLARRHKQQIPLSTRQTLRRLGSASTLIFTDLVSSAQIPSDPIPIISCLEVIDGYRCRLCSHLAGTIASIAQHCSAQHTGSRSRHLTTDSGDLSLSMK
jgi:hypothetical protein